MVKKTFPEAMARIYLNMYVCRVCKSKLRVDSAKIRDGTAKCRKCGSRALRPKKRPLV